MLKLQKEAEQIERQGETWKEMKDSKKGRRTEKKERLCK